jgi:hypothetical protein
MSFSGKYRYLLWREWRGTHAPNNWRWLGAKDGAGIELGEPKSCLFIMLNPSTADGNTDDPTIRRCVSFAKQWYFERLEVVNLFAYRATNPKELLALNGSDDPVGTDNQHFIERAVAHAGLVVCAWGEHGTHLGQDETVRGWLWDKRLPHMALGFTKSGQPRHPLYVKSTAELQRMP